MPLLSGDAERKLGFICHSLLDASRCVIALVTGTNIVTVIGLYQFPYLKRLEDQAQAIPFVCVVNLYKLIFHVASGVCFIYTEWKFERLSVK